MLTLILVVGLCSDDICTYLDVTRRMQVTSDASCYETALAANQHNVDTGQTPRYDCVTPERFLVLMGEKPPAPVEATTPRRAL